MKNATVTTISRADFFESSVKPDLEEILSFCREHGIPFFYTACVENSAEKGSVYAWNAVTPDSLGLSLRDDRIQNHICVANGDEAVPSIGEDVEMGLKEEPFITRETETEEFDKKSCFEKGFMTGSVPSPQRAGSTRSLSSTLPAWRTRRITAQNTSLTS